MKTLPQFIEYEICGDAGSVICGTASEACETITLEVISRNIYFRNFNPLPLYR